METNYDFIVQKDNLIKSLKSVTKKIDNLVTLMAETASKALVDKLNSLELEKAEIEPKLHSIDSDDSIQSVTETELEEWFALAKNLFKSGSFTGETRSCPLAGAEGGTCTTRKLPQIITLTTFFIKSTMQKH